LQCQKQVLEGGGVIVDMYETFEGQELYTGDLDQFPSEGTITSEEITTTDHEEPVEER